MDDDMDGIVAWMTNSELEIVIQKTYKTEKNRNILRDRILHGMTFNELIIKHFPEISDQSEHMKRKKIAYIQQMLTKFDRFVRKYNKTEGE